MTAYKPSLGSEINTQELRWISLIVTVNHEVSRNMHLVKKYKSYLDHASRKY